MNDDAPAASAAQPPEPHQPSTDVDADGTLERDGELWVLRYRRRLAHPRTRSGAR